MFLLEIRINANSRSVYHDPGQKATKKEFGSPAAVATATRRVNSFRTAADTAGTYHGDATM